MRPDPQIIEIDDEQLDALVLRIKEQRLREEDYAILQNVLESYAYLTATLGDNNISMARLRKLLFGAKTEKTANLVHGSEVTAPAEAASVVGAESADLDAQSVEPPSEEPQPKPKKPGHGRNGADDFPGATRVQVKHPTLQAGIACPDCLTGILYPMGKPRKLLRLIGRPPISATVYELEKLRCNLCETIFTAPAPAEAGTEKYDATVASMIALLKYGAGVPFYRQAMLQRNVSVPLAPSTQWDIVSSAVEPMRIVFEELTRQAAQGDIVHNDDTTVRILEFYGKRAAKAKAASASKDADGDDERKGLFTSAIVSEIDGHQIALYISGKQHAGENLKDVLEKREQGREPPIQMCDALSRNTPEELRTIVANCCAHARRQFVDIYENFPTECQYVLEVFRKVYHNDALARDERLSPEARLAFHQANSAALMEELKRWLQRQMDERLVEPNSSLGKAFKYLQKHWEKLTLFLRKAGAPLDNNICERALKKAILHRKNALFFKTQNGATIADIYMSLIHTCELNRVNPFDYLTALQLHATEVAEAPAQWMPWNYHEQLVAAGSLSLA